MGSKSSLERREKNFHGGKVGFERYFREKTVDAITVELEEDVKQVLGEPSDSAAPVPESEK